MPLSGTVGKGRPGLFREVLARNLGSNGRDVTFDKRWHKDCDTAPSSIRTLTRTKEM